MTDYSEWNDIEDESITHSRNITEIATALSACLVDIKDIPKNTQAFNYKYAPLELYTPMVRKACSNNGLFVIQSPSSKRGMVGVATMITHSSGQWIKGEVCIPFNPDAHKNSIQALGSIVTYLKRYALGSMFSISSHGDDYDGVEVAVEKPVEKPKVKPASAKMLSKLEKAASDGKESLTKAFADLTPAMKESLTAAQVAQFKQTARDAETRASKMKSGS